MNTNKTYTYNGKEYRFKNYDLEYADNVQKFTKLLKDYIREETYITEIQVKKYSKDINSPEYLYWFDKLEEDKVIAQNTFYSKADNLKELLKICVDGDVNSIEVDKLKGDELDNFFKFTANVCNDFFFSNKPKKQKSKK